MRNNAGIKDNAGIDKNAGMLGLKIMLECWN